MIKKSHNDVVFDKMELHYLYSRIVSFCFLIVTNRINFDHPSTDIL